MNGFLLFAIAMCVFAVVAFLSHYFSAKKVILRTLAKLPDLPVASLKSNSFSKITGKALHVKDPLIVPYSKRKCIFYDIKIEQKKSSGKSSYWKTLVHETKFEAFFVQRHAHYVVVNPEEHPRNYISYLNVDKNRILAPSTTQRQHLSPSCISTKSKPKIFSDSSTSN
ncbi:hypothetical protein ESY86_07200 [Subsaximicrobium wynnwilliamsii]|uniref:Uncharacterized protein n=1 Tax=Subsaximicrobium wynnwilliamsii TaxID=291179 RepID=A0A5C6ZK80_9FLAO|nr:hypothetical protein [Subsaximicrobium wynnwilliamsii]TXD83824.1 hypothetical protein ESY87_07360 [Subsaximicrobium wynnwilliamsii]TXD89565.1 hypothetical protein ESY86_07200 [Subsaximicrobium wynnwilliamsii]TXE02644.1 hypothetical protein ESY88_11645 [Subsaximicrobium wynnwilliamsii]